MTPELVLHGQHVRAKVLHIVLDLGLYEDVCVDTCVDLFLDVCKDVWIDLCTSTHAWVDMCVEMYVMIMYLLLSIK